MSGVDRFLEFLAEKIGQHFVEDDAQRAFVSDALVSRKSTSTKVLAGKLATESSTR